MRHPDRSESHTMRHPDRSEAEWRDLLFQLFAPELNLKIFMPGTLEQDTTVYRHSFSLND
jgi:hypothetical protein